MKANILSKDYALVRIPDSSAPDFMGANSPTDQTITIVDKLSGAQLEDTILHEALHIIDYELRIGLSDDQVARIAVGLYSAGCRVKLTK